jgi:hypothetical protein
LRYDLSNCSAYGGMKRASWCCHASRRSSRRGRRSSSGGSAARPSGSRLTQRRPMDDGATHGGRSEYWRQKNLIRIPLLSRD